MPSASAAMALGWSPAGAKSDTTRNGGMAGTCYAQAATAYRGWTGSGGRSCSRVDTGPDVDRRSAAGHRLELGLLWAMPARWRRSS